MNARRDHLDVLPKPIPDGLIAEQRIAVLRILATRLPQLAARAQIHIVGKGGTLLRLCEGTPRPSTDYDCDTSARWNDAAQARAIRQALRSVHNVLDLTITEPRTRAQPVRFAWHSRLRDGSTTTIDSYINSKLVPELANPDFRERHVRVHNGITTYTSERLYQTKADAFCDRCAGRDIYDIWYGLSHHLDRITPATRLELHERTNQMTELDLAVWNDDVATDPVLRGHVDAEDMLTGVMECLDTDPVVALHTHPDRKLGFHVDTAGQTVALGLLPSGDEPFHDVVRVPQTRASELADLALASRAPIWDALGQPAPSGGIGPQRELLTEIIEVNVAHFNTEAMQRTPEL